MSNYPADIDLFEQKRNAAFQGDPDGDWVMAEDINKIQDAIHAIQQAVGKMPQGAYDSLSDRIATSEAHPQLKTKNFTVYEGDPYSINGSLSQAEALSHYRLMDIVCLGQSLFQKADQESFIASVQEHSKVYGIIDADAYSLNDSMPELQEQIASWALLNVDGIFVKNSGYDYDVTRERQNNITDSVHYHNIPVILSASDIRDLLTEEVLNGMNPSAFESHLKSGDAVHVPDFSHSHATHFQSVYHERTERDLSFYGTSFISAEEQNAQRSFNYYQTLALLFSLDGFGFTTPSYGFAENQSTHFNHLPLQGKWQDTHPVIQINNGVYTREASFGAIEVDTNDKSYRFKGLEIPSVFVKFNDGDILDQHIKAYSGTRLINAINADDSPLQISLNKMSPITIDDLDENIIITADMMEAEVLDAIHANIGTAVIQSAMIPDLHADKITAGTIKAERIAGSIIEATYLYAGGAKINSAIIDDLHADMIKAGTISVDRLKGSVIEAINFSADTAYIQEGRIENLSAGKITSGDIAAARMRANAVFALNLYAQELQADSAKIDAAVISQLDADHIRAVVIDAINISTELATIDGAKITDATIKRAHIANGEITNAKIAIGAISRANIQDAAIGTAQIEVGSISTALIQEGAIETAQIAHGSITNAKIVNLNASKINAGTIDTGQVTIQGADGMLRINGNRLQVFYEENGIYSERVSIGDVNNDGTAYGFRVRGADGATVLYDESGVYSEGITDGAITNPKIGDSAIDDRVISADAIFARHIVAEQITGDHVAAQSITANHLVTNTITAGSAIIAEGAISSFELGEGSITSVHIQNAEIDHVHIKEGAVRNIHIENGSIDSFKLGTGSIDSVHIKAAVIDDSHIKNLNANKITAGKIKAEFVEIGSGTAFADGYDPVDLDTSLRQDLRLSAPLPSRFQFNADGLRVDTDSASSYVQLDYRGIYIHGGAMKINPAGGTEEKTLDEYVDDKIGYKVEVVSSNGSVFRNGDIETILSAVVYQGKEDVTSLLSPTQFQWKKTSANADSDTAWNTANADSGKTVTVTHSDFMGRATFTCNILE